MSSAPQNLSFTLDSIFNDNYNQSNQLDTKISTNEDLVRTYTDSYQAQMLKNGSLKILLLASILIMILILIYRIGMISSSMILFIAIIGIIVLSMLIIYFSYYNSDFQSYLDRVNRDTQKNLEKREQRPVDQKLVCDFEEETSYVTIPNDISSTQAQYDKLLKTSSNYNVWLDGDHKSLKPINENVKEVVDSNDTLGLTSGFDKLDTKYATYYDCEYTGSTTNGMPMKKKYDKSTIPCNYYIDYKESAKYVKRGDDFVKV
jgi:hypothetical protein